MSSASWGLASTKWNTVPPSISIDGRGWCVSTSTGVWNGGFGPHQPRHSSSVPTSVNGPVCRAELARPMISAPMPTLWRSAKESSTPKCHRTRRPSSARIGWRTSTRAGAPRRDRTGRRSVMPSPVPNPSREIERLWTRTWDMATSRATSASHCGRSAWTPAHYQRLALPLSPTLDSPARYGTLTSYQGGATWRPR